MDISQFRRSQNIEDDRRRKPAQSSSDPLQHFLPQLSLADLGSNFSQERLPDNNLGPAAAFGLDLSTIGQGGPTQSAPYAEVQRSPYQDYLDQRMGQTQMPAWMQGRGY